MKFGREAKVGIGVAAAYRASGQTRTGPTKPGSGFTLVQTNGLRLEMAVDFDAPALARLIAAIQTSTEISSGRG